MVAESPEKIHLGAQRCDGEPRFNNQDDAAVEEKRRADQSQHNRHETRAREAFGKQRDGPNGNARGDEQTERDVEDRHAALKYAGAAGQLVELIKDDGATLFDEREMVVALRQLFKTVRECADAVHDAPLPCRSRENERAACRDQDGGRDHRREHGQS